MNYDDNILAVYEQATRQEEIDGILWYASAKAACQELSEKYSVPLNVVVGVVAVLSPINKWDRNLKDAENMLKSVQDGVHPDKVKVCTFNSNKMKAWRMLVTHNVPAYLKGQKVNSFYANIMGDDSIITIDGHIRNVCNNEIVGMASGKRVTAKAYREITEAFKRVAASLNLMAYELQAIVWVAWRRLIAS